jgi:hypothetical protein
MVGNLHEHVNSHVEYRVLDIVYLLVDQVEDFIQGLSSDILFFFDYQKHVIQHSQIKYSIFLGEVVGSSEQFDHNIFAQFPVVEVQVPFFLCKVGVEGFKYFAPVDFLPFFLFIFGLFHFLVFHMINKLFLTVVLLLLLTLHLTFFFCHFMLLFWLLFKEYAIIYFWLWDWLVLWNVLFFLEK